jgi:DNA-binding PadR family transcriptional regulator
MYKYKYPLFHISPFDISYSDILRFELMEGKMNKEIRRAFLKYIVLKIIKDKPTHGYEIIKTIELRSNGRWTPSTGSIYPILESLESNGLIQSEEIDRRKVYSITPKGVVALDRMTQEKLELLTEMSRIINAVTENNDNIEADCEAVNIRGEQLEKTFESGSQTLKTDEDRR